MELAGSVWFAKMVSSKMAKELCLAKNVQLVKQPLDFKERISMLAKVCIYAGTKFNLIHSTLTLKEAFVSL